MKIGGFLKNSFVDYPGIIASVVFVPGCNMDCWYCHNRHLWKEENLIPQDEVFEFLDKRKGFIDGVVITGGEPTLQKDLPEFIDAVKEKGYLIKLDTNGLRPDVVKALLDKIDYIAMDLKAPPGDMMRVVSFDIDEQKLWESVDLIMNSGVKYEFRTTMMPMLRTEDIERIAERIKGARKYALQQYRKISDTVGLKNVPIELEPLKPEEIKKAADAASKYASKVVVRGL